MNETNNTIENSERNGPARLIYASRQALTYWVINEVGALELCLDNECSRLAKNRSGYQTDSSHQMSTNNEFRIAYPRRARFMSDSSHAVRVVRCSISWSVAGLATRTSVSSWTL